MGPNINIRPLAVERREGDVYDLFLATLGYEQRARYVAEHVGPQAREYLAAGFQRQQELSYKANREWFLRAGYEVNEQADGEVTAWCHDRVRAAIANGDESLRMCVDISSMSRRRIASVVQTVMEQVPPRGAVVDFVYAVAKYVAPPREMTQVNSVGPVLPQFAGWSDRPDRPVSAIVGIGYEYDKAVGALEYIEPATVWGFQPISTDERYDRKAERANRFLWEMLPTERRVRYHVDRPFDCFVALESLSFGVLQDSRVVLVPFGPKIFTVCCLLTAVVHFPRVAVWRVSSGENEAAVDRIANGTVIGLRAEFLPVGSATVSASGVVVV